MAGFFTGWTSVSVTRSIESVAGYFELGGERATGHGFIRAGTGEEVHAGNRGGRLSAPVISIHGDAR
ncbi:hypothetical protein OHD50_23205 [Escherichia coli]|nr:hypothetical protein [Escherichia coli]